MKNLNNINEKINYTLNALKLTIKQIDQDEKAK
jgi:hypothetical protein